MTAGSRSAAGGVATDRCLEFEGALEIRAAGSPGESPESLHVSGRDGDLVIETGERSRLFAFDWKRARTLFAQRRVARRFLDRIAERGLRVVVRRGENDVMTLGRGAKSPWYLRLLGIRHLDPSPPRRS